ncbi:flagellar hook-basal body complex protein, partial [Candidatus Sumerlaeota bacterium]|nr:flagellar hook-basal body complex protein [Candidatus Sumerlaeota bacterium]
MSLLSSLYTGVSGLQTYGTSMQVIGDNIANVSTVGFKSSRAEFAALLSQSIGSSGGGSGIGRGVSLQRVSTSFTQGSVNNTDRLTDLAINGSGFFVLNDGQADFYTRNGQFSIDKNGFLVNATGLRVQGNRFDVTGAALGRGDLQLGAVTAQPRATSDGTGGTGVIIYLNIDSRESIPAAFDASSGASAESTSNFSTTVTVYDSLGNSHATTVYLRKSIEGATTTTWEWFAGVDGAEINDGAAVAGQPFIAAQGTLVFDSSGALQSQTTTSSDFDFNGGATQNQVIGFDFGDDTASGGTGLAGSTQFASDSQVSAQSQDGFGAGTLSGISIGNDGLISGSFTNGQTQALGQFILADFPNAQGLIGVGSSLFRESLDSGLPLAGTPTVGRFGAISTFTL